MTATVERAWDLQVDVDDLLRSQAADPAIIRTRRPKIVELTEKALAYGRPLIEPAVLTQRMAAKNFRHNSIEFEGGAQLTGPLIVEHLAGVDEVVVMLCTIGSRLPDEALTISEEDIAYGLALDSLGSAAVHALSAAACSAIENQATSQGFHTSVPLSPGLSGWPVEVGQRDLLALLDPSRIGVEVTATLQMIPIKSVTVVVGVGADVAAIGEICDYCDLRDTCRQRTVSRKVKDR